MMSRDDEDKDGNTLMEKVKKVIYALILATTLTFLAPMLLGIEEGAVVDTSGEGIVGHIQNMEANVSEGAWIVLEILKYVLLVTTVAVVVVLRTGRNRTW